MARRPTTSKPFHTGNLPFTFLTAMGAAEDEKQGLENKAAADFLRDQNVYLETEVAKRTQYYVRALAGFEFETAETELKAMMDNL